MLPPGTSGAVSNFLEAEDACYGKDRDAQTFLPKSELAFYSLISAERALVRLFPQGTVLLRGNVLVTIQNESALSSVPEQV